MQNFNMAKALKEKVKNVADDSSSFAFADINGMVKLL